MMVSFLNVYSLRRRKNLVCAAKITSVQQVPVLGAVVGLGLLYSPAAVIWHELTVILD